MLKLLVLKMVKKYISIHKYKLSLFDWDDTKQAKSLMFNVVPQVEKFPKKKKKKKKMLDVIRTYNSSNYKLCLIKFF